VTKDQRLLAPDEEAITTQSLELASAARKRYDEHVSAD
jgi:hypothetical protein